QLAHTVDLRLVPRVLVLRHASYWAFFGQRNGVVRPRTVGGSAGGDQQLTRTRFGCCVEHVLGAVDVDVVHRVLVADRVEHEREVDQGVRPLRGNEIAHPTVPNVHLDEFGFGPGPKRSP